MVELTRRLFLIGSASALAAAAVAPAAADAVVPFEPIQKVIALTNYRQRLLWQFDVAFDHSDRDEAAELTIRRGRTGGTLFQINMNVRAVMVWKAPRGEPIVVPKDDVLSLSVATKSAAVGKIWLICSDYFEDESDPIFLREEHTFPSKGPATIETLQLDDRPRLLRRRLSRAV